MAVALRVAAVLVIGVSCCCRAWGWKKDFGHQPVEARPKLEVRYTDGSRTAFEVIADAYHLVGQLRRPHCLRDAETGKEWLSLVAVDQDGTEYSSRYAEPDSRINLYRRGPYLCEVHWLDVQVADAQGSLAPLKGDLALYCYPDKILTSITWHATKDFTANVVGARGIVEEAFTPAPFKAHTQQMFAFPLFGETDPLADIAFEDLDAVRGMRYDRVRGCYTIGSLGSGGFQGRFYHHPNRYDTVRFRVQNDAGPRTIYVCHENTGGDKGSVECGVLLDEEGHPLPIVVQISKNFSGEKEEPFYNPEDTSFSETYFPLFLDPKECRTVTSLHLYQNWGNHMVKQFSSLGAWMDYFHSSTGVTETTCYVPFKFGGLPGVDIADFRAMSQRVFWPGQPQHDNVAGHSFLWFHDGDQWQYMTYRGTTYRSTGPNWMDIRFEYLSTDGAVRATVDSLELPQVDELRQFIKVRYDILKPVTVPNARENFRALTAASWVQRLRYTHFAATGMDDTALAFGSDHYAVLGHPLPAENSFLAVYGDGKGGNAFVVRRWTASIAGASVGPAASVYCEKSGDTRLLLAADADELRLEPGDCVEFEAVLMPFGSMTSADAVQRETVAYGSAAPRVIRVKWGKKENDFPAVVRARRNRAEFTIQGGRDVVPVIVTNLEDYRFPRLYQKAERGWRLLPQARVGQLDGVQTFCDGSGKFGAVFLVHSDNAPQTLQITAGKEAEDAGRIRVTPLIAPADPTGAAQLQHAVHIQATWMETPLSLRFPETLHTDALDFIDHRRDDMPPRKDPAGLAKVWEKSEGGSIWFEWEFDNQVAGGRLSPNTDCVDLEFWLENRRPEAVNLGLQFCPVLAGTIFEDRKLERTWGLFGGEWKRLAETDRGPGRFELCHYRVAGAPKFDVPLPWGRSNDLLDIGVVVVASPDEKYLFAIAWPECGRVLTNAGIPCVHSDPPAHSVPPGKRFHMRGKVFLMEGTLDDLLRRVRREIEPMAKGAR